jgi:hypothetical protein
MKRGTDGRNNDVNNEMTEEDVKMRIVRVKIK